MVELSQVIAFDGPSNSWSCFFLALLLHCLRIAKPSTNKNSRLSGTQRLKAMHVDPQLEVRPEEFGGWVELRMLIDADGLSSRDKTIFEVDFSVRVERRRRSYQPFVNTPTH